VALTTVRSWRRPASRADLALAPGEAYAAGGTWLFSEPQPGLTGLVDLTALGWPAWEPLAPTGAGGLRIAATCTIAELQRAPWPPALAGAVRACADALLMSWKVQRAATVGGNLALALPAGAMTSLLAGLGADAVVWTADGGERRLPVAELVTGVGTTALLPGEVIRAVDVPAAALSAPVAVRRTSLADRGRSAAVVVGRRTPQGPVLTVTASTPAPLVLTGDVLAGVAAVETWYDDPHGAPDWRAAQTRRLVAEVLAELEAAG